MANKKVEISKKAFDLLIKAFTEEMIDTMGAEDRDGLNDEVAIVRLYDEIKKDFPQYFEED